MKLEQVNINMDRVKSRLEELSLIGKQPDNSTTRLSYSEEWKEAVNLATSWMHDIGMETEIDAVGNLFGCYEGIDSSMPAIMTGSHIDTVPGGGPLDGALGVIAGIEVANMWKDVNFKPNRPLKVIATIEEESSLFGIGCFGSRMMVGTINPTVIANLKDKKGKTFNEHLESVQLDPNNLEKAIIDNKSIKSFLELHIEQGSILDDLKKPIGIVSKVVGIKRISFRFLGKVNHGNTPMHKRSDALVAASKFALWVNEKAVASKTDFVATIGKMSVLPGQQNIIPGQVDFTLEIRSASLPCIEKVNACIAEFIKDIEKEYNVDCIILQERFVEPQDMDPGIIRLLNDLAMNNKMDPVEMVSWAGHDAKIISSVIPTGMIFVPSVGGISHSPHEFTHWEDIEIGIELLYRSLLYLAQSE